MENRKTKRLYLDLETSPNIVWTYQIGYKLSINHDQIIKERCIICACWKWEDEDKVHSIVWKGWGEDKHIVKKMAELIDKADEVIAHNGDRFDIKWLRTRALLNDVRFPIEIKSIDTLKRVRSKFLFNSNRLDYLSKITGGHGKLNYGGIDTLNKIYLSNDKEALEMYVDYCKIDVTELQRVYSVLKGYLKHESNESVRRGGERYCCPKCASSDIMSNGTRVNPSGTVRRRMKCKSCKYQYSLPNNVYRWWVQDRIDGKI